MKRIFTLSMVILITLSAFTQVPQKMSYQCVIRNASGVLVTNQNIGIRISVLQGTTTGSVVYQETYNPNPQTNANGLMTVEIGGGVVISGTFSTINWASGPYFLKTETDPTGGTNYTIVGTSQLLSVPYAMYAEKTTGLDGKVDKVTGKGLSTEDFTTVEKNKLVGIATGAEVNVNADWNATTGDAQILNKPTTLNGYGITDAVNTTSNQSIAGDKTFTGTISTSSRNITNVANPVNAQDAATKAYVDELKTQIEELQFVTGIIVKDKDGNVYKTVTIGTQVWMSENLGTTKFNDGTSIPYFTDALTWSTLQSPGYCYHINNPSISYGAYYNWYAVNTGKLCPLGWHVPSRAEWNTLATFLGGESVAGIKLMEAGTAHWPSPNNGTNESGFTALPGGYRNGSEGNFYGFNSTGAWLTSTEYNISTAYIVNIYAGGGYVPMTYSKNTGYSIRCIKD